jgi:hypothetical protein
MPLELGIFLGAKRYGTKVQKNKRALVFDISRYRYQRFISDLAGMDIHEHRGQAKRAIVETRDWLANVSRRELPSSELILDLYGKFRRQLPAQARKLRFDPERIPYVDFERMVAGWLTAAE